VTDRKLTQYERFYPYLRILAKFGLLIAAGLLVVWMIWGNRYSSMQASELRFSEVQLQKFDNNIFATAQVVPKQSIILSTAIEGRANRVFVEAGQFLSKNQIVATLENPQYAMQVLEQETRLLQQTDNVLQAQLALQALDQEQLREIKDLELRLSNVDDDLARNQEFLHKGIVSESQYRRWEREKLNLEQTLDARSTNYAAQRKLLVRQIFTKAYSQTLGRTLWKAQSRPESNLSISFRMALRKASPLRFALTPEFLGRRLGCPRTIFIPLVRINRSMSSMRRTE